MPKYALNSYLCISQDKIFIFFPLQCNELLSAQREIERMKEEVNAREIKLRWSQNKLKNEGDSHKVTQGIKNMPVGYLFT